MRGTLPARIEEQAIHRRHSVACLLLMHFSDLEPERIHDAKSRARSGGRNRYPII
jgi:hypothetical protein